MAFYHDAFGQHPEWEESARRYDEQRRRERITEHIRFRCRMIRVHTDLARGHEKALAELSKLVDEEIGNEPKGDMQA